MVKRWIHDLEPDGVTRKNRVSPSPYLPAFATDRTKAAVSFPMIAPFSVRLRAGIEPQTHTQTHAVRGNLQEALKLSRTENPCL